MKYNEMFKKWWFWITFILIGVLNFFIQVNQEMNSGRKFMPLIDIIYVIGISFVLVIVVFSACWSISHIFSDFEIKKKSKKKKRK